MSSDLGLSREQLLKVLSAIPETISVIDADLVVRYVNRPQEQGYTDESVRGTPALDFVPEEHRDGLRRNLLRVLETADEVKFEIPIFDADGTVRWLEGTLVPIEERKGRVVGVVSVTQDVTDRRLAEVEVENLRRLVPLCSWCGKIRSDEGYWSKIEAYIEDQSTARVTHGICPSCESEIQGNGTDGPS